MLPVKDDFQLGYQQSTQTKRVERSSAVAYAGNFGTDALAGILFDSSQSDRGGDS